MDEFVRFAQWEFARLVSLYNAADDPAFKYKLLAKLMEEVGEFSEALLHVDSLQRPDKLEENSSDVASELADVVLVAFMLSEGLGVDLKQALLEKMDEIRARKY